MLDKIFNKKNKIFYLFLLLLILLHSLSVIGLIYDFPKVWHRGWYFHHGGDQESYFRLAKSLINLRPIKMDAHLGYPLFLIPFIYLYKAKTIEDIVKPIFIMNTFILFNLSIILIALISKEIANNKLVAGLAASLWTFYPWALYLVIGLTKNFNWAGIFLAHHLWLPAMPDSISAFLLFLSVYLFLLSLRKKTVKYLIFTAIVIGWSVLVRPLNGVMILLFISTYLYQKRIRDAICFGLLTFAILLTQFWYNLVFWKRLLMQDVPLDALPDWFSVSNLNSYVGIIFTYAPYCFFLIAVMIFGFIAIYRRSKPKAIFILCWAIFYSILYGLTPPDIFTLLRYLIPVFPAFFILLSSPLLLYKSDFKNIIKVAKL